MWGRKVPGCRLWSTELRGEKIDIIPYDEDPGETNRQRPQLGQGKQGHASPLERGDDQDMLVIVPDDQLSLPSAKKGKTLAWRRSSAAAK